MNSIPKISLIILSILVTSQSLAEEPRVLLHLLNQGEVQPKGKKFWIDWTEGWMGIKKSKTITGVDAEKIIALLRTSLKPTEATHFCGHSPVYGIVASGQDGKTLKTSLCFTCLTWVKPKMRLEITGEAGVENELCRLLRSHIELPPKMLKNDKSEKAGKGPFEKLKEKLKNG